MKIELRPVRTFIPLPKDDDEWLTAIALLPHTWTTRPRQREWAQPPNVGDILQTTQCIETLDGEYDPIIAYLAWWDYRAILQIPDPRWSYSTKLALHNVGLAMIPQAAEIALTRIIEAADNLYDAPPGLRARLEAVTIHKPSPDLSHDGAHTQWQRQGEQRQAAESEGSESGSIILALR